MGPGGVEPPTSRLSGDNDGNRRTAPTPQKALTDNAICRDSLSVPSSLAGINGQHNGQRDPGLLRTCRQRKASQPLIPHASPNRVKPSLLPISPDAQYVASAPSARTLRSATTI